MADNAPKGGGPLRSYPPKQERLFLGPYPAGQVPQELLTVARRVVERFQWPSNVTRA